MLTLYGKRIIIHEPRITPKIELYQSVPVSDAFRMSFDTWLADTFGYREPYPVLSKQGEVFVTGDSIIMRRDDYHALKLAADRHNVNSW